MKIGGKQTNLGIAYARNANLNVMEVFRNDPIVIAIEILTKHRSVRVVWRYGQKTMYILILYLSFFLLTTVDLFYSCEWEK